MKVLGGARPRPRACACGPAAMAALLINDKPGDEFLSRAGDLEMALEPLRVVGQEAAYNVTVQGQRRRPHRPA